MTKAQDLLAQIAPLWAALRAEIDATTTQAVTTADELRAALLTGGTLAIAPGLYAGNFVARQPVTLIGPPEAILMPLDRLSPTLSVQANDVHLAGFTVRSGAPDRECVVVGQFSATSAASQPHRVTLLQLRVEAGVQGGHRGIALHGAHLTVRDCRITGFWEAGRDSQGIWMHNGPGPYTIENNYVEASGENILVGGDTVKIQGCVPADIVIRGNVCYKPDAWRTNGATVKIGIELKMGRRVLIENNVIDGNWKSGQVGTPIVITTRNQQNDSPWVVIDDVIIRGNRTVRCAEGYAVSILGRDSNPSEQTQRILIEHNLFSDSPNGFIIGNGVASDLTIRRNTLPAITGNFLAFHDAKHPPLVVTPLTFTDNVVRQGEYGMNAGDYPYPFTPIVTFTQFTGNLIEKHPARQIKVPAGNTWVETGQFTTVLEPGTFKLLSGTAGY